jgi:glutamate transport system permease protein
MSKEKDFLFDDIGPIAQRRVWIGSAIATLIILWVMWIVIQRFAENGQFELRRWELFAHPGTWKFLAGGLANTLKAAAITACISFPLSIFMALARLSKNPILSKPAVAFVEFFRSMPLVILILFIAVSAPTTGIFKLSGLWVLVIGMSMYYIAVFSEVVRAGIISLPSGQREAAMALGMNYRQSMRLIELPQALYAMTPAIMSQLLFLVQDTSIGYIIPYEELLRRGKNIESYQPISILQTYLVVTLVYAIVSLSLLWLTNRIERSRELASPRIPKGA